MVGSFLAPKWPLQVPFCGIDHQKPNFSLISDSSSVGGCCGRPMLLFWKLVDETQMVKPPELTIYHNSKKYLVLLPLSEPFTLDRSIMRHPVSPFCVCFFRERKSKNERFTFHKKKLNKTWKTTTKPNRRSQKNGTYFEWSLWNNFLSYPCDALKISLYL